MEQGVEEIAERVTYTKEGLLRGYRVLTDIGTPFFAALCCLRTMHALEHNRASFFPTYAQKACIKSTRGSTGTFHEQHAKKDSTAGTNGREYERKSNIHSHMPNSFLFLKELRERHYFIFH